VNVAPWRGLLQELAGIKDPIIRLEISVAIDLPLDLDSWPVADEAGSARAGRNKQEAGNRVDSVVHVLSPLNNQIRRDGYCVWQLCLNPGMNVDEIDRPRTRVRENAKIVAKGEYGIERSQRLRSRVIAAGDVGLDAKS